MTGIDSWSTTAGTNATADGGSINWAEGQPAQSVNNSARQMCADVRSLVNDIVWFPYGTGDQGSGNLAVPGVYASGTSFTIAGVNVTSVFHAGRRVRAVGSGTGTIYGSISSSSFSTNTTVNVTWDSGSLSNETLVISLSQIPVTGTPVPAATKGTITNDNAAAGNAGEYTETVTALGSAVALTSGVSANVATLSLTAGDWDITGIVDFTGNAATTVTYYGSAISATSATKPTLGKTDRVDSLISGTPFASTDISLPIGPVKVSLAATTPYYLIATANFAVNTCSAYGHIRARRVR